MSAPDPTRRSFCALSAVLLSGATRAQARSQPPFTLYTFGDSILDCARYNAHGVHPGQLLVRNHDALFPEFVGQDLLSRGPARLVHRAVDGATARDLPAQLRALAPPGAAAAALLTVGGNDLLQSLAYGSGAGIKGFEAQLERFLQRLPIRPVLVGTVYDPTLGDDARNFLGVAPRIARANLRRMNEAVAAAAQRYGRLIDLHAHFLQGDPSWFTRTIEPSLRGASEVRRAFLPAVLALAGR